VEGPGAAPPADVDELVEVGHQELDQALPSVRNLGPDPGNEGPQGDRRHDLPALGVPADRRGGPASGSEHPFEFTLAQSGRGPELLDHPDNTSADRDIAHHLCGPGIDLGIGLVREPCAVLGGVG
jgi:hypothetical protein